MQIWIDADACPKLIKEIVYRAAERTQTFAVLVSNQILSTPYSAFVKTVQVCSGFDVADRYIVEHMQSGDLVITADIPLADAVVSKNGTALNPRGEQYTKENIKQRLSMRDFTAGLRDSGMMTGGPAAITQKEIQTFANCLDRFLNTSGRVGKG